jgi:hypothetical protein
MIYQTSGIIKHLVVFKLTNYLKYKIIFVPFTDNFKKFILIYLQAQGNR